MAFSSEELATYKSILHAFIDRNRPRPEIRDEVNLSYRVERQSVIILEIRPAMSRPGETIERSVAKPALAGLAGVDAGDIGLRNVGIVVYLGVFLAVMVLLVVLFYRTPPVSVSASQADPSSAFGRSGCP